MRTLIVNGTILTPFQAIENGSLTIVDGKIEQLFAEDPTLLAQPASQPRPDTQKVQDRRSQPGPQDVDLTIDAGGRYVSPGFIDLHTHGGGGHDFMDGTAAAIIGAAKAHMQFGTTSIAPTTLTCSDEELFSVFESFRQAKAEMRDGPNLLGLHLEGPYVSPAQAGAQDMRYAKLPERSHWMALLAKSDDIVMFSAAPELPGALELGLELQRRGIRASIAHSDADYEEVLQAMAHGYSHVVHLYSAMSTLRRINAYRHLGVLECAYLFDELSVEVIADGKHLPPELLRLILKCIPTDRISLVTDSSRGAGLAENERVLIGSLKNGQEAIIEDGVAMMPDRSRFASSVCTTDRCVRTVHQLAGAPLLDAVRMMSTNPARVIGVGDRKGVLAPGMDADICIFDEAIHVSQVLVGGRLTVDRG